MTPSRIPIALTIAGSDSSGGAGIQSDLKTFQTFGVHGLSVITSITAQNSRGITTAFDLPPSIVEAQLEALFFDFKVGATKTGMLSNPKIVEMTASVLKRKKIKNLIVDPMILSKTNFPLLKITALQTLKKKLLPLAAIVTPNLPEAEVLSGITINSFEKMKAAARAIHAFGPQVLIKGGHIKKNHQGLQAGTDLYFDGRSFHEIPGKFFSDRTPHGTGCVYSAVITALVAKGESLLNAIKKSKIFIEDAISRHQKIGKGRSFLTLTIGGSASIQAKFKR